MLAHNALVHVLNDRRAGSYTLLFLSPPPDMFSAVFALFRLHDSICAAMFRLFVASNNVDFFCIDDFCVISFALLAVLCL